MTSRSDVPSRLNLSESAARWLRDVRRPAGVPGPDLPDDAEARRLLSELAVDPEDQADVLAARPDRLRQPDLWWVLDRVYHHTIGTMGAVVPIEGHAGWPGLPPETGAAGRHLAVWAYLAALPEARRYHREHGVPDRISWDSLALGDALRHHKTITGASGLGLFDGLWSPPLCLRGVQYSLGRLEYTRGALSFSDGPCGYTVGVHIPAGVPLDSSACDDSLELAREFFPRHFPDEPVAFFHCSSWLLDPQLAEYLPESSNIVRFQRRFRLLPLAARDEAAARCERVGEYIFGPAAQASGLEDLPQDTTLQRAYVAHARAGRNWHTRTGWQPFQTTPNPLPGRQAGQVAAFGNWVVR